MAPASASLQSCKPDCALQTRWAPLPHGYGSPEANVRLQQGLMIASPPTWCRRSLGRLPQRRAGLSVRAAAVVRTTGIVQRPDARLPGTRVAPPPPPPLPGPLRTADTCPRHLWLQEPGSTVLVAGATGGVGQLVTAKLLDVRTAWGTAAGSCLLQG